MGHIKRHHLSDAKVIVPPDELLQAVDRVFSPLLDRLIHNKIENRTLADLRDLLATCSCRNFSLARSACATPTDKLKRLCEKLSSFT